jgi:hypothetical protein
MKLRSLALAVAAIATLGCDETPNTPTTPTLVVSTELFSGILPVQGTGFYSFTPSTQSKIDLTLASITPTPLGAALPSVLTLGLGIPRGTGCAVTTVLNTSPALSAQLSQTLEAGTYCANIVDPGNLPVTSNFVVRIVGTPTSLTPPPEVEPTTMTFASNVTAGGSSTRTFAATRAGTVSVTLESAGPPSDIPLGIGLGIVRTDNTCGLSRSITTSPGSSPQFEMPVDAGRYCVRVFDVGNVPDSVAFSVKVVHP